MIHSTVPPQQVNRATVHATVSEFWHVLSGQGEIWRGDESGEEVTVVTPGVSIDISGRYCLPVPLHWDGSAAVSVRHDAALSLVTTSGGAMGAAGAIPGGGLPSAAFDVVAFTEASVLYALTLAEIHGIHPEDIERRRLLVQTVLIGDSAITALNKGAGRTVPYWGKQIVNAIPMSAVLKANKVLGPRFITKYGTKQGVLVLSKQIPLGLGIGVGAFANHMIGRTIVGTARKVFGPAPEFFEPRPDPGCGWQPLNAMSEVTVWDQVDFPCARSALEDRYRFAWTA